ncbi:hypothetical protein EDB19DRAFT_1578104, partial [Suillus lakei]
DPDLILSLKYWFANTTITAYNHIHEAIINQHPKDDTYNHYCIKQAVCELSGVIPIINDMCTNMCLVF